jgi:hypothetical protein
LLNIELDGTFSLDHHYVRVQNHFALREMIESRNRFIRVFTRRQRNHDFNRRSGEVVDRANFELSFSGRILDRTDY